MFTVKDAEEGIKALGRAFKYPSLREDIPIWKVGEPNPVRFVDAPSPVDIFENGTEVVIPLSSFEQPRECKSCGATRRLHNRCAYCRREG